MFSDNSFNSIVYYFVEKVKVTGDNNLFRDFFEKGGFFWGFVIAIAIALIVAALCYYVFHHSYRFSKLYVWIIVLFLSGTASYNATSYFATRTLTTNLAKMDTKNRNAAQFAGSDEDKTNALSRAEQFRKKMELEIKEPNPKISNFAWTNAVWTMLFFFCFSLLFKNFTCYGKAVPWGISRKNRNKDSKK